MLRPTAYTDHLTPPGGSSGIWTVPVHGNDAGEPCYTSTLANAYCKQAWKWNLDRIVDTSGNVTSFTYEKETNYYSRWSNINNLQVYDRGGYLTQIDYGMAKTGSGLTAPVDRVVLSTKARCKNNVNETGDPCPNAQDTPAQWPDTPVDLICEASETACLVGAPSFFSTRYYSQVVSQVDDGGGFDNVDKWVFDHKFPDVGTGEQVDLWLNSITRTGYNDGGSAPATLPSVQFNGVALDNRVDQSGSNTKALAKKRIEEIRTETGGRITVTYGHAEDRKCTAGYVSPDGTVDSLNRSASTKECFAAKYAPTGSTAKWRWFHKYVVKEIDLTDDALHMKAPVTGSVSTNNINLGRAQHFQYEYLGAPAWRYDVAMTGDVADSSWGDWRGYERAIVHQKKVADDQVPQSGDLAATKYVLFRGMDGSRSNIAGGTIDAKIDTYEISNDVNEQPDRDVWAGRIAEQITLDPADNAREHISRTYNQYKGWKTVSDDDPTDNVSWLTAYRSVTSETRTFESVRQSDGSWSKRSREHVIEYTVNDGGTAPRSVEAGTITKVVDHGATNDSSDDTCTQATYWANSTAWIVAPASSTTRKINCSGDIVADSRTWYDQMAPQGSPGNSDLTRGLPTTVWTFNGEDGLTDPDDRIVTKTSYDTLGRISSATDGNGNTTETQYNFNAANNAVALGVVNNIKVIPPAGPATVTKLTAGRGLPWEISDPNGTTTVTYDSLGRTRKVFGPDNSTATPTVEYTYETNANDPSTVATTSMVTSANSTTSTSFYDGWGRLVETHSPSALDSTWSVNTASTYDALGLTGSELGPFPADQTSTSSTLINANPDQVKLRVDYTYDPAARVRKTTQRTETTDLATTTINYWGDRTITNPPTTGATVTATNVDGTVATIAQARVDDPEGDLVASNSDYDTIANYGYNSVGALNSISLPTDATNGVVPEWTYRYDLAGRRTKTIDPDVGTTNYTYDDNGNQLTSDDARQLALDANNNIITSDGWVGTTYDALNRPVTQSVHKADGTPEVTAEWNYGGATNGDGRLHWTKSYNWLTLPSTTTNQNPTPTRVVFTDTVDAYTPSGLPTSTTTAWTGTLTPDLTNSYTVTNSYTPAGYLTTSGNTAITKTGQTAPAVPALTLKTDYVKGLFNSLSTTAGGQTTTWAEAAYDKYNRTSGLNSTSTVSGTTELNRSYSYDNTWNRLQTTSVSTATTEKLRYDYTYDTLGQITEIRGKVGTDTARWCYTHSAIGRLKTAYTTDSAECDGAWTTGATPVTGAEYNLAFTYDGTRLSTVTADATPDVANDSAVVTYNYDITQPHAADSTTSPGTNAAAPATATLAYDATGRIITLDPTAAGEPTTSYTYSAEGNLSSTTDDGLGQTAGTTTNLYESGGTRLARQDPDGTLTIFLPGIDLTVEKTDGATTATRATEILQVADEPVATRVTSQSNGSTTTSANWVYADHTNSIRLTLPTTTETPEYLNYRPYGDTIGDPSDQTAERGYLNKTEDPNGDVRLDHRSYTADLFILTTPDPLLDTSNPQTFNPYAYSANNPITAVDPSGMMMEANPDHASGSYCDDSCQDAAVEALYPTPEPEDSGGSIFGSIGGALGGAASKVGGGIVDVAKVSVKVAYEVSPVSTVVGIAGGCFGVGGDASVASCAGNLATAIPAGKAISKGLDVAKALKKADNLVETAAKACSFSGMTLVLMADGTKKPIYKVKIGDHVIATDPETGEQTAKRIDEVFVHTDNLTDLAMFDGTVLTTTEDHPFWSVDDRRFEMAADLAPGERVLRADGRTVAVAGLRLETSYNGLAYNLSVEGIHTYHVGVDEILVHNKTTCGVDSGDVADAALGPGPFAREGVALPGGKIDNEARRLVNAAGDAHGCHTCGAATSGRPSGKWVVDHVGPTALVGSRGQTGFPHCSSCSSRQGGIVNHLSQEGYDFD